MPTSPTEPTPFQQTYLNLPTGPIGRLVVLRSGNPGPGLGLGVENVRAAQLDIGHFLAIPTEDGQVTFAVTLAPDVRSDLDVNELVFEQDSTSEFEPPMTARPLARVWTLSILGNTAGTARPAPFAPLYFASRLGVDFALGQHRIPERQRLPIGVVANGDGQMHPVYLHAEYLLGPQGVHANWGGISGLSGKTSKKIAVRDGDFGAPPAVWAAVCVGGVRHQRHG